MDLAVRSGALFVIPILRISLNQPPHCKVKDGLPFFRKMLLTTKGDVSATICFEHMIVKDGATFDVFWIGHDTRRALAASGSAIVMTGSALDLTSCEEEVGQISR